MVVPIAAIVGWGAKIAVAGAIGYGVKRLEDSKQFRRKQKQDVALEILPYMFSNNPSDLGQALVASTSLDANWVDKWAEIAQVGLVVTGVISSGIPKLLVKGGGTLLAKLGVVGSLTGSYLGFQVANFTFTSLFSGLVQSSNYVLNFNWMVSDAELLNNVEAGIKNLYGLLGAAVGRSTGWLACGALPGALTFAYNPAMAAQVLTDLDEEGKQEVLAAVAGVTRSAFMTLVNAVVGRNFSDLRRTIKQNPDGLLARLIKRLIGDENFKKWGNTNQPSFTIRKDIIEKNIDKQPEGWKQFYEQLVDEFGDACVEAGYVVSNSMDAFLASQALMRGDSASSLIAIA